MVKAQLSQLEVIACYCVHKTIITFVIQNLPKVVNQLHLKARTETINVVEEKNVQMVDSKVLTSQPDSLQDDQSTQQPDTDMVN